MRVLSTGADGGGVQLPGRRGLHAGLIPAHQPHPGVSRTSRGSPRDDPPWSGRSPAKQGGERGRERGRHVAAWEPDEFCLSLPATSTPTRGSGKSSVQQLKGIRAVSIMDTLLAGDTAPQPPAQQPPCPPVPTVAAPAHRARGRTPDWIKRIFDFAKRGHLDQLRGSLRDMEATLVRNLSDHHGNNLLHVLAAQGHAPALAWLCAALGTQLDGALADENRSGLTPAACAVKYGHAGCVEWLVSNTRLRDKLSTRDGERCLLHTAAKYGQETVVRWLVSAMRVRHLGLDQRDRAGDTPLHLAARAGALEPCKLLLAHGADVTLKNDAGLRAADVASDPAVRSFLTLFEASIGVAGELTKAQSELEALQADTAELRGYFRDVLSVGKRLAKERDELCRGSRSSGVHQQYAHDELAALAEENRALRERLGLVQPEQPHQQQLSPWGSSPCLAPPRFAGRVSGEWLVGGLADMEHRLLRAEEGWRRLQLRTTGTSSSSSASQCNSSASSPAPHGSMLVHKPLDLLMRHVEAAEQRRHAADEEAARRRSLSSSESSLDTLLQDNIYSQLLEPTASSSPLSPTLPQLSPSAVPTCGSREEVRRRLRELALTSESGNASVLEVIEPGTSEEDEATPPGDYQSVRGLLRPSPVSTQEAHQPPDLLLGALGDADDAPQQLKKRTFLQKLSLKASWPAKRKLKPGKTMTPDDFKETYMRHSPSCTGSSSEQEAGSSGSSEGKSSATVEAAAISATPPVLEIAAESPTAIVSSSPPPEPEPPEPPEEPPPPPAPVEPPVTAPAPPAAATAVQELTSLKQMSESMSVTTSEDSGCIVARPSSAASKSDSLLSSRPDSSSSFKLFPPPPQLLRAVSPAPSDASHCPARCGLLGKIEEARPLEVASSNNNGDKDKPLPEPSTPTVTKVENTKVSSKQPRAWYDLSDDEPDLLSSTPLRRSSSDEEQHCA